MFNKIQLLYLVAFLAFYLVVSFSRHINERFCKGKIITRKILKRLLWIKQEDTYISTVSLIFISLAYIYLIALIPLNIISLFLTIDNVKFLLKIYIGIWFITWVIECLFLPKTGIKG